MCRRPDAHLIGWFPSRDFLIGAMSVYHRQRNENRSVCAYRADEGKRTHTYASAHHSAHAIPARDGVRPECRYWSSGARWRAPCPPRGAAMNTIASLAIGLVTLFSLLAHDVVMSFGEPHPPAGHSFPVFSDPSTHDAYAELVSFVDAPSRPCDTNQPVPTPPGTGVGMTAVVLPAALSFHDVVIRRVTSPFVAPGLLPGELRAFLQVYLN